jgi:uncharacterized protein YkwD
MEANNGVIFVGQTITIPPAGSSLPTTTPIPANLPRGTKIEYRVLPGDTLAGIAAKFNSITENIIDENDITDANALQVGQTLQIPVNLVTATATLPPSSTPVTPTVAGATQPAASSTPGAGAANPTAASNASCSVQENTAYVTELLNLINSSRTASNLPALTNNAQLAAAAKNHAQDMLCNNYFSDIGLDRSTPQERATRAGFTGTNVAEVIYAAPTATPQTALDWWMNNVQYKDTLMKADVSVAGVAYVKSNTSLFGGYFVVLVAKP